MRTPGAIAVSRSCGEKEKLVQMNSFLKEMNSIFLFNRLSIVVGDNWREYDNLSFSDIQKHSLEFCSYHKEATLMIGGILSYPADIKLNSYAGGCFVRVEPQGEWVEWGFSLYSQSLFQATAVGYEEAKKRTELFTGWAVSLQKTLHSAYLFIDFDVSGSLEVYSGVPCFIPFAIYSLDTVSLKDVGNKILEKQEIEGGTGAELSRVYLQQNEPGQTGIIFEATLDGYIDDQGPFIEQRALKLKKVIEQIK